MKKRFTTHTVMWIGLILLLGAAVAFAHGGRYDDRGGYGGHMMGPGYGGRMMDDGYGYGPHMRGYGDTRGYDGWGDLSEEDRTKLRDLRNSFIEETRGLRDQMDEKRDALRDELDKENPDQNKVMDLQKQLSGLRSEFDQKALQHRLEVRKVAPESFENGRGYRRGGGPGYCW